MTKHDEYQKLAFEKHREIAQLFPYDWQDGSSLSLIKIGYQLKLLGFEWKDITELRDILTIVTLMGIVEINHDQRIRAGRFGESVLTA